MDVAAVHARPAVAGQECGVDVDDAVLVGVEDSGADLFHVAGRDDEVDVVLPQRRQHGLVESVGVRVGAAGQMDAGDALFPGVGQCA
nr:hypothetical protein [Streptomyces himalayensis]